MNPILLFFVLYFSLLIGGVSYIGLISKKQDLARNLDPFTDDIGRPAGESLRVKIEGFQESFSNYLMIFFVAVFGVSVIPLLNIPNAPRFVLATLGLVLLALALIKLKALRTKLFDHRLGYRGEVVVSQYLNALLADGFKVFHDVIFTKGEVTFNIDHVVVGPSGVFAIETKTRRKPKHLKGKSKARVVFDGSHLAYPTFTDQHGINQAMLNAKTLSNELSKSTGDQLQATPILALPGWFVQRKKDGDLLVVNPKELFSAITGKRKLEDDQILRACHQLKQLCIY